jgi:hypothetical protein
MWPIKTTKKEISDEDMMKAARKGDIKSFDFCVVSALGGSSPSDMEAVVGIIFHQDGKVVKGAMLSTSFARQLVESIQKCIAESETINNGRTEGGTND